MSGDDLIRAAVARSASVAEVMIGRGVLAEAGALYARHFAGPAVLMADERGWGAAGPAVLAAFKAASVAAARAAPSFTKMSAIAKPFEIASAAN